MTQSEFQHILECLGALSPHQMFLLREELESKLALATDEHQSVLSEAESADQELQRRLFEAGLLSEIKPPRRTVTGTDQFKPVLIKGESLSETIIQERR